MNLQIQETGKPIRVKIKNGLDLPIGGAPGKEIAEEKKCRYSALLGRDFPRTRFELLVDEGNTVKSGEAVLRDRRHPDVLFTSPVSGKVFAVRRGAKRALVSLQISNDGEENALSFDIPGTPTRDDIRRLMLISGLWTALRSRPFEQIPDPDQEPKALFITAIDTQPLAPDPAIVIAKHAQKFVTGINALCKLVEVPLYLCKSTHAQFNINGSHDVRIVEFDGSHPAGLPGTHIHALSPIGFDGKAVWHIGYQDVISVGRLVQTGTPWFERVVSLAGPAVKNPRLITVPLGAEINDIIADEIVDGLVRIISGSLFSGRTAAGDEAFLGQRHHQITALFEAKPSPHDGWRRWWRKPLFDTGLGGEPGPLIPTDDLDRVAPPGVLAVPLLRALLVGDIDRARDLGALEWVEEDLALSSYVCASKAEYGALLRDILDQLHKEGVSTH